MSETLKPCPFCGEQPEIHKHFRDDIWSLIHRCKVFGPLVIDWTSQHRVIERWNHRAEDAAVRRLVDTLEPHCQRFAYPGPFDAAMMSPAEGKRIFEAAAEVKRLMGEK